MSAETSPLDTSQLSCAVHNDLWLNDRPNQLIADTSGRPIAVKIPGLLTAAELSEITPHIATSGYYDGSTALKKQQRVRRTTEYTPMMHDRDYAGSLPIGYWSGVRFPDSITEVSDLIVRQSAGTDNVRAINLTISDARVGESPCHFDNPEEPLSSYPHSSLGSNLHLSLISGARVELALLDDDETLHEVAAIEAESANLATPEPVAIAQRDRRLSALYLQRCTTWAVVNLQAGDGLFLQGEARLPVGRYPVVHRFIALAGEAAIRRYGVLKPRYDDKERVLNGRAAAEQKILVQSAQAPILRS